MIKRLLSRNRTATCGAWLMTALLVAVLPAIASAAPQLRFSVDDHSDFTMIGNSLGFNCGVLTPAVPDPVVGTVDRAQCGNNLNDHGPDVYWRSDQPAAGMALADTTITAATARSTAVLTLPANAVVLYARLYWATQRPGTVAAGATVTMERAGTFAKTVTADAVRGSNATPLGGYTYYQSSADITKEVQAYGNGAYRVGNLPGADLVNLSLDVGFASWSMVVFYRLDTAPVRNLALFDGFDLVTGIVPALATLQGFLVPAAAVEGRLGVIAYQGDADLVGDSLSFNGTLLTDASNPATNFFNSSRSNLGVPVSVTGDLPQLTGGPGSMIGLDQDIVDITNYIKAGDTSAAIAATTAGDTYFLGAFITAVSTNKPVFTQTNKIFTNLTRTDGTIRPGDKLQFTIDTKNTGSDQGTNVTLTDALPVGMTYVPGTIQIGGVAQTDQPGDDQAEYVALNRTLTTRLGTGATAVLGGTIDANGTAQVKFQVTVDANAMGILKNQAMISAQGKAAVMAGDLIPNVWNSGDGKNPNVPTLIPIDYCLTNAGCSGLAPLCDTSSHPYVCVCNADSDCPRRTVCDTTGSRTCVECTAGKTGFCDNGGEGAVCLLNNTCGCNLDTDCNGRLCNVVTNVCPPASSDVKVTIARPQGSTSVMAGTTVVYTVTVTNNGPSAVKNLNLADTLPAGVTGATWTCAGMNSGMCPAAMGSGGIGSLISLPAGASLVYTVSVPIPSTAMGAMWNYTVNAPVPPGYLDPIPANNTATDSATLINGPDLSLSVTDTLNQDGTVTYDLALSNKGPGPAQGATVTYTIPAGATVTAIDAGQGWTCTPMQGQIVCNTTQAIAAGTAAPDIRITVQAPGDVQALPVSISAVPTVDGMVVGDANPNDNIYTGTTDLGAIRVEGGGFGCSAAAPDHSPLAGSLSSLLLLGLLLLQQRKRTVVQ